MDAQTVLNLIGSALISLLGIILTYVNNKLETTNKNIESTNKNLADLRVKVAEDYIHKDRFVETVEQMMSLLQRIENKLDQKADKH